MNPAICEEKRKENQIPETLLAAVDERKASFLTPDHKAGGSLSVFPFRPQQFTGKRVVKCELMRKVLTANSEQIHYKEKLNCKRRSLRLRKTLVMLM
ncbi:hypothetical protein [Pluralibacter sp.]|uniref:hypothetical protein n=1 Tax=Pluralibacter sp. TaxID=1920032 RepID=UPI0025E9E166|nr:hypothetical protein [Pluralibacter sp.]MBV8044197.1 hypothetical protein [Pluralibacter sp.]